MKPNIKETLKNYEPHSPNYLSDFDISEPPPANSVVRNPIHGALHFLPEQKPIEISTGPKKSVITPDLLERINKLIDNQSNSNPEKSIPPKPISQNNSIMTPAYSPLNSQQPYQYPPPYQQYPSYPTIPQTQPITTQYPTYQPQSYQYPTYPYPQQQSQVYQPPTSVSFYNNVPPFTPIQKQPQQQQPQEYTQNHEKFDTERLGAAILQEEEHEKPRSVNFHHGNEKPFSVTFHFGTNQKFVGYRRPDTKFTFPTFTLSRPILVKNIESPTQNQTHNQQIDSTIEICKYPAHLYKATRGVEVKNESYVDDGSGVLTLQCVNNDNYILTLENNKGTIKLRLVKEIKPRIKKDCFVQIMANEFSDSKTASIFLVKCQSSSDAQELMAKIHDCVTK